jgi:hypothetical protein
MNDALQSKYTSEQRRGTNTSILHRLVHTRRTRGLGIARRSTTRCGTSTRALCNTNYLIHHALCLRIPLIVVALQVARECRVPRRCRRESLERSELRDLVGNVFEGCGLDECLELAVCGDGARGLSRVGGLGERADAGGHGVKGGGAVAGLRVGQSADGNGRYR